MVEKMTAEESGYLETKVVVKQQSSTFSLILKNNHKFILCIVVPLVASVVPITIKTKAASCAYVLILMATFWLTECLPLGVTSFLPAFLFPYFGIVTAKEVAKGYFQDIVMLFYAGLVMATSIETCRLHERVALKILMHLGSNPIWLLLGLMGISAFLSMWMSNTATASMMLPLVNAIVVQLIKSDENLNNNDDNNDNKSDDSSTNGATTAIALNEDHMVIEQKQTTTTRRRHDLPKTSKNMATGFMLSCAYSATIGGIGSLVGTATNVLLKGYFDAHYPDANLNFLTFLFFALPISFIMIIFTWLWITFLWLPKNYIMSTFLQRKHLIKQDTTVTIKLKEKYDSLGPWTWEQVCVGLFFILLVVLWITRDLVFVPGWDSFFPQDFVSDATPAITVITLMFICPKRNIFSKHQKYEHLVNYKKLTDLFPWNVLFLIGGGLVLADGFQKSKLSDWLGEQLQVLMPASRSLGLLIVITASALVTEFTSNVSTASIFLPIVDSLAVENQMSPIYLLLPMIISISFAFMFPVASPNNALIFANNYVRIKDMIKTGVLLNILGLATVFLASHTWLHLVFDTDYTKANHTTATAKTNLLIH